MCEDARVALSARLDGEAPGRPDEAIKGHLSGCVPCQRWQQGAVRLGRLVRLPAVPGPDLTGPIMSALAAGASAPPAPARPPAVDPEAHARRQILRVAVAAAAVVQLALAVPTLLSAGATVGLHATREMASFDLAVAVGFLLAAYRPERARAYVPLAFVLALCLAVTSGVDVLRGATVVGHEIGHLVAVVQAGLLWALNRADRADHAEHPDRAAVTA